MLVAITSDQMKMWLRLLLLLAVFFSLPAMQKKWTCGFRLAKLHIAMPCREEWDVPLPAHLEMLHQPYFFLGKGAQCYAFASQDGKYVIKLFRFDHPQRNDKIVQLFNACKLAYDHLRDETGLIYVHLNLTQGELPTLRCTDPRGRRVTLPLDHYRFALQRRAEGFFSTLDRAKERPALLKERIDQCLYLLKTRIALGIENADLHMDRNIGFLDGRAIELDFGRYQKGDHLARGHEMEKHLRILRAWLQQNAPEWTCYLDASAHLDEERPSL
jgi:hypothetical protein